MRSRANVANVVMSGLFVWACAKANDTNLLSRPDETPGQAGSSGSGARGGATAGTGTGGRNTGTGGAGGGGTATGGGTSSGGSGNRGGRDAAGGRAGAGGSGGAGATGGSGGSSGGGGSGGRSAANGGAAGGGGQVGVPPELLERADLVMRYQAINTTATSSNSVQMRLHFENRSPDALPLEHVEVRYWMTAEASVSQLACDYAGQTIGGAQNVQLSYVEDDDDSHVSATFTGGRIPARTSDLNATEFQIRAEAPGASTTKFDQTDDYSFDAAYTRQPAQPHLRVTAYLAGELIWGCEPSGRCFDDGEGGAGGEAGHAGAGAGGSSGSGAGEAGQGGQTAEGGQGGDSGQSGQGGQSGQSEAGAGA